MKISLLGYLLLLACSSVLAAPVNLQTCTVAPTTGGVAGCPTASLIAAPVTPTTWTRSIVNNIQAFRPFSTLKPADFVWAGSWQPLGSITPALATIPPVTIPPVVTPPVTPQVQDVTITLVGALAPQSVVFSGVASPACFALNVPAAPPKQICLP